MTAFRFHLAMFRSFIRAWFDLTTNERWALILIVMLALLGLLVRGWRLRQDYSEPYRPPVTEKEARREM